MSDIKPPGPPSPESKPPELPKAKEPAEGPPPSEKAAQGSEAYLRFNFTSQAAYVQFKSKFLAQMANEMIRQVQYNNDRMVEALKKLREDQE